MGPGRAATLEYSLERRPHRSPAGVPLAAALTNGRPPILQRSIRYHRPRAPFCGTGACTNCLVRVNGVPNVRACRYVPSPGDRIESENAWPSPRFDLLGVLDTLFPGGIDTVRGFRRPLFARTLYQRVVRRLAAYGRIPDPSASASVPRPGELLHAEHVVVGAGGAGRSAAERLIAAGARPLLLDRSAIPDPPVGADVRPGLLAAFLPPPTGDAAAPFELLAVDGDGRGLRIGARRVVLATGGFDAGLWFANGDRPGVLTAEGAEALAGDGGRAPFARSLLFGGGSRAATILERWGESVEAVAAPGAISPAVVRLASEHGVPLYPRSLIRGVGGRRSVRSAVLVTRGGGPTTPLEVDAVVLAHRRLPNNPMLFQAGARMRWDPAPGAYVPVRAGAATTVPGLSVAGALAGSADPSGEVPSGAEAAERSLSSAPWPAAFPEPGPAAPGEMEGYYRELLGLSGGTGRWIACACEDVGLPELKDAHRRGYSGIEVIKRYTGLGTGLCQGRYCLSEALLALSVWEGRPPSEVGYITQRPPVMPVSLEALASLPELPEAA